MTINWPLIASCFFFLALAAFFAASETALMSFDDIRVKKLANKKARSRIRFLLMNSSLLLIVILLGSITVNTVAVSLLEKALHLENLVLSAVAVTAIKLFFSEIAPNTIAVLRTEKVAVFSSRLLYPFYLLARPVARLLERAISFLPDLIRRKKTEEEDGSDEEHLAALQSIVAREGIFSREEKKLITSVLSFAGREVWNIMTPRVNLVSVSRKTPVREVIRIIKKTKHSKIPVYDGTDDNIVGVVHLKEVFPFAHRSDRMDEKNAGDIMVPMYYVPETKKLSGMLDDFKAKRIRMATVVDEYGSALGIVTIADVLGEVIGELTDERFTLMNRIIRISPRRFLVSGDVSLTDFNQNFGTELVSSDYETLAGFVIQTAGDIPDEGFSMQTGKYRILLKEKSDKHLEKFIVEEV